MNRRPLIVMALKSESNGLIENAGFDILYTGVGKVNATYALMQHISDITAHGNIPLVINMGSAGSGTFNTGETVASHRFVQRDMDVTGLGFRHGETPFESHPSLLEFDTVFSDLRHGICGSGDSFLQGKPPIDCDIIDMEAYALAKVCYLKSIPFACVKYITDGADDSAHVDWQENLHQASHSFVKLLEATYA